METEKTYVNGLDILLDVFYKPLLALTKSGVSGVSLDELDAVFTPLKPLRELHHDFISRLRDACKSMRVTNVGKLFTDLVCTDLASQHFVPNAVQAPYLQQYTTYVNNYNKTLAILQRSFSNSQFERTIQALQGTPRCNNQNLYSFLITPVQRMPRYQLLLTVRHDYFGAAAVV